MLSAYTDLGMSGNPKEGQWWNDDRAWESTIHTHTQKGEQQEEKWGCTLGFYPTLSPGPANVSLELIPPLMDVCEFLFSSS